MKILFENDDFIAFEKPYGISSAPLKNTISTNAVDIALKVRPNLPKLGLCQDERGLFFRLDSTTSGILVFAKSEKIFESFYQIIRHEKNAHQVTKKYYAKISKNFMCKSSFIIDWPIFRKTKNSKKVKVVRSESLLERQKISGKVFYPQTKVIRSITPNILEIQIQSGAPHQIRAHLSEYGLPILGDTLYHGLPSNKIHLHHCSFELKDFFKVQSTPEWLDPLL